MTFSSIIASKAFRHIVLLIWVVTIFWMSLDPSPPVPEPNIIGWDKLLHAFAYGTLTFLGGWAMSGTGPLRKSTWVSIAAVAICLGGVMELFQMAFTTTRTAEFADFLADAFGSGVVLLGVFVLK